MNTTGPKQSKFLDAAMFHMLCSDFYSVTVSNYLNNCQAVCCYFEPVFELSLGGTAVSFSKITLFSLHV